MLRKYCFILCVLCLAACSEQTTHTDGTFLFADGSKHTLADYRGQWVVINYWAVWCKPCLKEIPHFNRLHKERAQGVAVLGVDFDNSQGEALTQRIQQMGIEFPVLLRDPSPGMDHPRPHVLPTTVIYDPQGQLHKTLLGDQSWESLDAALGTPSP